MRDQGPAEQLGFIRTLRQSRIAAFRKEIVPHFRYVFQSGFGLFASAIFFTVLLWYVDFIKAVPEKWPADLVGVALISLAVLRAPLRTYFRPADPVFLMAMETRLLQAYIKPALQNAMWTAVFRTLAIFSLFAPIYLRSPVTANIAETHPVAILGVLFAIVAACNVYAGWRERKSAARSWRVGLKLARWLLTIVIIAALLLKPLVLAVPLMLLYMVVVVLLWRIPKQHSLPWEKLIDEEAAVRRRWMAFLGWFVDIPTEASKPARRRWIAWTGNYFLWQHRYSWHFLYTKVFLRGETFGSLWRWIVVSGVIIVVSGNVLASAVIYGISIMICGLQLSELRRIRFVETADTLPIAPEGRLKAAAALARFAGVGAALLLGIIGVLTAGIGAEGTSFIEALHLEIWLPLIAFGLLWSGWWMPRKIAKYTDEDEL
ncbi:ABC transporter permease [Cohnella sp. WQ 127256]|uniref:ABC transporter permease n=1 Tax=Cohnella sp. WQ 127256 TaxID=2938790 RepID=UPI002118A287